MSCCSTKNDAWSWTSPSVVTQCLPEEEVRSVIGENGDGTWLRSSLGKSSEREHWVHAIFVFDSIWESPARLPVGPQMVRKEPT